MHPAAPFLTLAVVFVTLVLLHAVAWYFFLRVERFGPELWEDEWWDDDGTTEASSRRLAARGGLTRTEMQLVRSTMGYKSFHDSRRPASRRGDSAETGRGDVAATALW